MGKVFAYARVSTDAQDLDPQTDELRKDGFDVLVVEKASGASQTRPELARLVREMKAGDILKVVRIDRLARSVSHLLEVIETLEGKGAHFRSLRDPIDTTTPQGMFSLQVLGAVAQLERALIADRSKAGLASARARGRVGGNPGVRAGDPAAIAKIVKSMDETYVTRLIDGMEARAGSGCLNSFALEISGFLPGFLGWRIGGATQGGRSPTGVARPMRGEVHAAALCGR